MITFSIICLASLICTIVILLSWMWRKVCFTDEELGFPIMIAAFVSMLGLAALSVLFKLIIKWGAEIAHQINI